jgi:hypothetical protein
MGLALRWVLLTWTCPQGGTLCEVGATTQRNLYFEACWDRTQGPARLAPLSWSVWSCSEAEEFPLCTSHLVLEGPQPPAKPLHGVGLLLGVLHVCLPQCL